MQHDQITMAVAKALTLANIAALERGVEPKNSIVTIAEETTANGRRWRINYGPRDFIQRLGGDLIVYVDEGSESVEKVLRGQ